MNSRLLILENLNTLNFSMRLIGFLDLVLFFVFFVVCLPLPDLLRKSLCSVRFYVYLSPLDDCQGNGSYFYLHCVLCLFRSLHSYQDVQKNLHLPHGEFEGKNG